MAHGNGELDHASAPLAGNRFGPDGAAQGRVSRHAGDAMEMPAIELYEVSKIIGRQRVLDRLRLAVQPREFFALLGPSGCGKTTTLRLIAGFDGPTSGEIYLNGQPMSEVPPFQRDVNTVFQNYALFPHLTVSQNIAFGVEMQRLAKPLVAARVAEAVDLVRLGGLEQRYPHQLSGGEQQRVALARAVARQPSVLLLDEPLGALDLQLRKEMQQELKRLQRRLGMTFLYVTHDQEEALTMADRMAVMQAGRLWQIGTPLEIYEHPSSLFVASFVGETNLFRGRIALCAAEAVRVDVGSMALWTESPNGFKVTAGQVVNLALRPEKILLQREPLSTYRNNLSAVVEAASYLGTEMRYTLRVSLDLSLVARQQNLDASIRFKPGERIFACFPAHSARLLPETTCASHGEG
jgi:spermidine/putrescine transport system ATP-binding protein